MGPVSLALSGWTLELQQNLSTAYHLSRRGAAMAEQFGLEGEGEVFWVGARRSGAHSLSLLIAQRYTPAGGGFNPGVALAESTRVLFIGAGTRLLAYSLDDVPRRLWEEKTPGFYAWAIHDGAVLMLGELEMAAWDLSGRKLWTHSVDPPWSYRVENGWVHLNDDQQPRQFRLDTGEVPPPQEGKSPAQ